MKEEVMKNMHHLRWITFSTVRQEDLLKAHLQKRNRWDDLSVHPENKLTDPGLEHEGTKSLDDLYPPLPISPSTLFQ